MSSGASVAARVAGVIGALGYLFGVVEGPILGVLAGLALVTFGRALVSPQGAELVGPAAFGVMAGAVGAVALRWGTLDLADIRGAQGVIGPTLAVEPLPVALLAGAALAASTVALGLWLTGAAEITTPGPRWWWVETATVALFLASLFCGPPSTDPVQTLLWLASAAAIGGAAIGLRRLFFGRTAVLQLLVAGGCAAVVSAAAAVAGSVA